MNANSTKPRARRRFLWLLLLPSALAAILAPFALARFHFSNQDFPRLAHWQGNDQPAAISARPLIIGHRGSGLPATFGATMESSDGAPANPAKNHLMGNTETSVRRGIEAGADWIEIDIRASHDGKLVVFHDENINPDTNGSGLVRDLSLHSLKTVQVLVDPPEPIPTLDQLFAQFQSPTQKWILDIKTRSVHDDLLAWIEAQISKGALSRDRLILFGSYEVLQDYSGYELGYTATWGGNEGARNRLDVLFNPAALLGRCERLGARTLVLPTIFTNQPLIDAAKSKGINVWVYGSDNPADHRQSARRGITGLIVDRPADAIACFKEGLPQAVPPQTQPQ